MHVSVYFVLIKNKSVSQTLNLMLWEVSLSKVAPIVGSQTETEHRYAQMVS